MYLPKSDLLYLENANKQECGKSARYFNLSPSFLHSQRIGKNFGGAVLRVQPARFGLHVCL